MCWETRYGMLSVQRTATKDIHVKKAFQTYHENIHSFFNRLFRWDLRRLYTTHLEEPIRRPIIRVINSKPIPYIWEVTYGFHSAKEIELKWDQEVRKGYLFVGKGRHISYKILSMQFLENRVVILNCIIPKGSKYYVNEYGEYVSDQLIVLPN